MAYQTSGNARLLNEIPEAAKTALDLGCATGLMAAELKQRGIVTDGVTFDPEEVELASEHCDTVWHRDLELGLQDAAQKQYDVIILSHVLEHLARPQALMGDLAGRCGKNTLLLCAIPNMLFLYNRFKLLFGRVEYAERGIMDYTHVRWYTQNSLIELFEHHGFEIQKMAATGNLPLGPLRRLLPASLAQSIDDLVVGWFPGLLAWELSFVFAPRNSNK